MGCSSVDMSDGTVVDTRTSVVAIGNRVDVNVKVLVECQCGNRVLMKTEEPKVRCSECRAQWKLNYE